MGENIHKGWPAAVLGTGGMIGSWVATHWLQALLALFAVCSYAYSIFASWKASRTSSAQERLAQKQLAMLACEDCILNGNPQELCPHTQKPYPKGCPKCDHQ